MTNRIKLLTNKLTIYLLLLRITISNVTAKIIDNTSLGYLEIEDEKTPASSPGGSITDILGKLKKKYITDTLFGSTKEGGLFDTNECFESDTRAKKILNEMGIENKEVDDNVKFALGPCNPVVMIPGMYATRLILTIDCKKFSEKKGNLLNLRLFCGSSMCKTSNDFEEHVLWPALFDSPFELFINSDNSYSSCFGHFFNYFRESECPKQPKNDQNEKFFKEEELESICWNDEAVKVTFFGATEKTQSSSQCGLGAIKNILSVGSQYLPENWLNVGATRGFTEMYKRYHAMGYRPGFSMAGVPYDFRRFVSTNDMFKEILTYQIEKLYENTGKQVIIIGHSFGTVNTLNYLLSKNFSLKDKIKKFIAVGPPFAGVSKDIGCFVEGTDEFAETFSFRGYELITLGLDRFGQQLLTPFLASGFELRPNPIMHKLTFDKKYKDFILAVEERIMLENLCKNMDCSKDFIEENSKMFNKYFDFFPKFTDKECQVQNIFKNPDYHLFQQYYFSNGLKMPQVMPCRFGIYDVLNCPFVRYKQNEDEKTSILELNCKQKNETQPIEYYNYDCSKDVRCIDSFFHQNFPYPYDTEKMNYIFDRFEKKYSQEFPGVKLNNTEYFDSREKIQKKVEQMMHHQEEISNLKDMTIPPIDTIIIFGGHLPSATAYLYEKDKGKIYKNDEEDILMKNGDGTVPTWTSVLPGLKWLYEKKVNNLPQKIQIVEYCSLLGNKGSDYAFDYDNPDKEFMAISCDCIGVGSYYNFKSLVNGNCEHALMHSDPHLIGFIEHYLLDVNNFISDVSSMTDIRKTAVKNYNNKGDYEMQCNSAIRKISDEETSKLSSSE